VSHTRKILSTLESYFGNIGTYMCYPLNWACGDDRTSARQTLSNNASSQANAIVGAAVGTAIDVSCGVCTCCTRAPCCCIGTAFTVPTGLAAASVLGVFGCITVPCVAVSDIPEHCKSSAPKEAPAVQSMK
jgi:hypothetical protein